LSELVERDPAYCQWILRTAKEPEASNRIRENAAWLLKNAPQLSDQDQLAYFAGPKHHGRLMSDVVADDPAYCQWILLYGEEQNASEGLKFMANWLNKNAPQLKEKGSLCTGRKHRGRPLSEVAREDPSYCQWILREAKGTPSRLIEEQASWLRDNAPHLQVPVVRLKGTNKGISLPQVAAEDPRWCFYVLGQPKAFTSAFADAAEWLRENVPELLEVEQDDESALGRVRQRLIQQYGHLFVVRHGKHQMKTFPTVVKEDPGFVQWAIRTASDPGGPGGASKNIQLLAAFSRHQQNEEPTIPSAEACRDAETEIRTLKTAKPTASSKLKRKARNAV